MIVVPWRQVYRRWRAGGCVSHKELHEAGAMRLAVRIEEYREKLARRGRRPWYDLVADFHEPMYVIAAAPIPPLAPLRGPLP